MRSSWLRMVKLGASSVVARASNCNAVAQRPAALTKEATLGLLYLAAAPLAEE